jgi:hypothetical protein
MESMTGRATGNVGPTAMEPTKAFRSESESVSVAEKRHHTRKSPSVRPSCRVSPLVRRVKWQSLKWDICLNHRTDGRTDGLFLVWCRFSATETDSDSDRNALVGSIAVGPTFPVARPVMLSIIDWLKKWKKKYYSLYSLNATGYLQFSRSVGLLERYGGKVN